jgi:hypothetical protein
MADERDNIRKEFKSIAEETAAIFGETLTSISANFARQLKEETNQIDDLGKALLRNFKNDLTSLSRSASGLLDVQDKLRAGILKQSDINKEVQGIQSKINKILLDRQQLIRVNGSLTAQQEKDFEAALAISKEQTDQLRIQGETLAKIDKDLGPIGTGFKAIGGILKKIGLESPFDEVLQNTKAARGQIALNTKAVEDLRDKTGKIPAEHRKTAISLLKQNQSLKSQAKLSTQIGTTLKGTLSTTNILAVVFAKVVGSVFALNKAQTDFRRLTGESAAEVGLFNDGLLTSVDLIQTQIALTEQFGLNAREAFGTETLQEVGEITKAIGLSATESGNLAKFSKIAGDNLNGQLDALSKSVPKAFSQKQILSETANVSSDIALAMGNSAYEIGQAVIQAKQLGLSLSDVNNIADGLLDIESSLQAEFEAEVITGKQLNFERARGFALQNKLGDLTEEIKNNEDLIKGFATANRIEQEAIAKTLNMSRQQMADMVMSSKLVNTLTEEQRANAAGVSIEQLKQLDINQSIDDSINKITQSLAGPLEKFAQLLQYTIQVSDYIAAGASGLLLYNSYLKISTALKKKNIALTTMEGLRSAGVAAIEAIKSVVKTPIIGPALAAAAGITVYGLAKSYMSKGEDVISEGGYGNRTLMGPKGSIALNNNDTVIAGTNLFPKDKSSERNAPTNVTVTLSPSDIKAIASAVREGASQATINLDGDRISTRLQPSLAVNTRRYSV